MKEKVWQRLTVLQGLRFWKFIKMCEGFWGWHRRINSGYIKNNK